MCCGYWRISASKVCQAALLSLLLRPCRSLLVDSDATALHAGQRAAPPVSARIRVACVGDSITRGTYGPYQKVAQSESETYPAQLQDTLGGDYDVRNFGYDGACVFKNGNYSYWNTSMYTDALEFKPDIVLIMLGTNDAIHVNWFPYGQPDDGQEFQRDYLDLIRSFQELESNPRIFLAVPPPLLLSNCLLMNLTVTNVLLPQLIPRIAEAANLPSPVDVFSAFERRCPTHIKHCANSLLFPAPLKKSHSYMDLLKNPCKELFHDGVHPKSGELQGMSRMWHEMLTGLMSAAVRNTRL